MQSGVERLKSQLEIALGQSCTVYRHPSNNKKLPKVFVLLFHNYPNNGYLTAYSYGLSASIGSDKTTGRELTIQVKSSNENWGHILGFLISHLREDCPFDPGQIIRFGQSISEDSTMQHFLVQDADHKIGPASYQLNKRFSVNWVQLVPIYEQELAWINRYGFTLFLSKIDQEKEDVQRKTIDSYK